MGYVAADPEVSNLGNGSIKTKFKVATNHEWTDKEGEKKQVTDYHRIVAWKKLGEIAGTYLKKGSGVYLEGKLVNKSYKDKEGKNRVFTEIIADTLNFLSYKKSGGAEELNLVEVSA